MSRAAFVAFFSGIFSARLLTGFAHHHGKSSGKDRCCGSTPSGLPLLHTDPTPAYPVTLVLR